MSSLSFDTLSVEEIREINSALRKMFAGDPDSMEPAGERPGGLLESACGRQLVGAHGLLKYGDAVSNAMTLAFGLIKNHPFHNGNKRTALVSLLVHLDKNKLVFKETVDHRDVYEFIKRVAEQPNARDFSGQVGLSDSQLQGHIGWLKSRVRSVYRGEHPVTVRQLKRILAAYGFDLCDPNHNFADIFKTEEVVGRSWLGFAKRRAVRKKVFQIACSGPNQTVQVSTIKEIRKRCKLQELDGVDSDQFYSGAERTDFYLNSYRKILNRLAYE